MRVVVLKSEISAYMTQGHGKMQDGCHAWTLSYYCGGQREIFSLHCINITSFLQQASSSNYGNSQCWLDEKLARLQKRPTGCALTQSAAYDGSQQHRTRDGKMELTNEDRKCAENYNK